MADSPAPNWESLTEQLEHASTLAKRVERSARMLKQQVARLAEEVSEAAQSIAEEAQDNGSIDH